MATKQPEQVSDVKPAPTTWSNVPLDEEVRSLTPREKNLADLAEKNKDVKPQRYDVTSKNSKALRVVYDVNGRSVAIRPGEMKKNVLLHPSIVTHLNKSDLEFTLSE